MKGREIPAMGILLIEDNSVRTIVVQGVRVAGSTDTITKDDLWHIGSDGKAMTATMIAKLVEEGKMAWDEPLPQLLPHVPMNGGFATVTLRGLLAHTAGLPHDPPEAWLENIASSGKPLHEQRLEYAREILNPPPLYPPGTNHGYSNGGLVLAALAAEIATGKSYEDLMREIIFVPLGMASAGFGPTKPGENLGHEHGKPVSGLTGDNPPVMAPAGEIHLTLGDWAKFAIDQMKGETGDGKILKAESYRTLHTAVPPDADKDPAYALGWGIKSIIDQRPGPYLLHAGSNGYWFVQIVLCPRHRSGLLIAANAGPDAAADKAENELIGELLPLLTPAK